MYAIKIHNKIMIVNKNLTNYQTLKTVDISLYLINNLTAHIKQIISNDKPFWIVLKAMKLHVILIFLLQVS